MAQASNFSIAEAKAGRRMTEFEASLSYIEKLCLTVKKRKDKLPG